MSTGSFECRIASQQESGGRDVTEGRGKMGFSFREGIRVEGLEFSGLR